MLFAFKRQGTYMPRTFKTIISNAFSIILTSLILSACGGGGSTTPSASILSTSYSGNTETVKFSDGTSVVNTAKSSTITWASDHITKTTAYMFQDGTTNSDIIKVNAVVSAPSYVGSVETILTTYGDGTISTTTKNAISTNVRWASDGVTRITEYTFADGSKFDSSAKIALLASTPILLPDLRPTYLAICGPGRENGMVLHKPIILDLNKDGRKDILLTMWCDQPVYGVVDTGPVPSRILAFLQQADGTFINGTKDIFGSDTVSMSGASIHAVAYDFNGDGYDDVVIANNKEDGRLLPDNTNNVQNSYMMSSGNGTYTVGQFGTYQWGYDMFLMDNNFGKKDIVATPIGYGTGSDAWRYDGRWTRLPSDYGWAKPNTVIFKRRAADQGSQIAITDIGIANTLGFALYTRTNTTEWSRVSELILGTYSQVPYTSWNTSTGLIPLITVDGQDYVMPYIEQGCELKIKPNDESVAVMQFGAYKLPTKVWDGKPLVEGQNMTWQSQIIGLSVVNGTLTRLNISVKNEITQFTSLHMSCADVNADGYDDIIVEQRAAGGTNVSPFIYINDKNGGFALVDTSIFPSASPLNNDTSNMCVDMDGDGISDLMYWAVDGVQNNSNAPIQIQLFKGLRNITASDLK